MGLQGSLYPLALGSPECRLERLRPQHLAGAKVREPRASVRLVGWRALPVYKWSISLTRMADWLASTHLWRCDDAHGSLFRRRKLRQLRDSLDSFKLLFFLSLSSSNSVSCSRNRCSAHTGWTGTTSSSRAWYHFSTCNYFQSQYR